MNRRIVKKIAKRFLTDTSHYHESYLPYGKDIYVMDNTEYTFANFPIRILKKIWELSGFQPDEEKYATGMFVNDPTLLEISTVDNCYDLCNPEWEYLR